SSDSRSTQIARGLAVLDDQPVPGDSDADGVPEVNPLILCYTLISLTSGTEYGGLVADQDKWTFVITRAIASNGDLRNGKTGSLDDLPDVLKQLGVREVRRRCGSVP